MYHVQNKTLQKQTEIVFYRKQLMQRILRIFIQINIHVKFHCTLYEKPRKATRLQTKKKASGSSGSS